MAEERTLASLDPFFTRALDPGALENPALLSSLTQGSLNPLLSDCLFWSPLVQP